MPGRHAFLAVAAFVIGLPWGAAGAAPQVLGLVASNGVATPLNCDGRECSALFSAFCLQETADAPASGTPYAPTADSRVTLVATTADGRRVELPGERYLAFESLIGFTSVRVSLPRDTLAALGATRAAVEIGPAVSLVPVEMTRDRDPLTDEAIALATGPMRAVASQMFEAPGAASDAARITMLLINALPADRRDDASATDAPWRMAESHPVAVASTADGVAMARQVYETCRLAVPSGAAFNMRDCLEMRHADLMAATNQRFWKSVGGS